MAFGTNDQDVLIGCSAKENIEKNEAIVYVPNKLLITVERARTSEIGFVFDNHESIFKATTDRDTLTLILFVMYEQSKGQDSFWYPYFQAVDPGALACYWDNLSILDDPHLIDELTEYRNNTESDWDMISKLLKLYSGQCFDPAKMTYSLYQRCATLVLTRCFGWGLPTTIVAPMIDQFNHSPLRSVYNDIINKRLHLDGNKIYAYSYNFEREGDEKEFLEDESKYRWNVKRLFREDESVANNKEYASLINGHSKEPEEPYSEQEVF